jgi:type II secretion system protein N
MKKRFFYGLWTLISLLFFLRILFPGEFAEALIEAHADREIGPGSLNVEGVAPALPLGIKVRGMALKVSDFPPVTVRDVRLTPSWLTLVTSNPGAGVTASLFGGTADIAGRIRYEGHRLTRLEGQLTDVDLSTLTPFLKARIPVEITLSGRGDGVLDLSRGKALEGTARLSLADVTVGFKDPLIPLEKLVFGSVIVEVEVVGRSLTFSRIHVDGTEVDAELRGTLTLSDRIESSSLNITGTVNPDPGFVKELTDRIPLAMLADPKLLKQGRIPLRISGTLAKPKVSFK